MIHGRVFVVALLVLVAVGGVCAWPPEQDPYDLQTAFRAVMYSAAAYSDRPEACLPASWGIKVTDHFTGTDMHGHPLFSFAAVSPATKEVILAFRGTNSDSQLLTEFFESLTLAYLIPQNRLARAFNYFVTAADALQDAIYPAITTLLATYPDYRLLVTGHSLGASIASVITTRMFINKIVTDDRSVWQYTFGQPRVGNYDYATLHDDHPLTTYRITHHRDPIVHVPPCLGLIKCVPERDSSHGYHHGLEIFYSETDMPTTATPDTCLGEPYNEDPACSQGWLGLSVSDHLHYFNIEVGEFCANNHLAGSRPFFSSSALRNYTALAYQRPRNEIRTLAQVEATERALRNSV